MKAYVQGNKLILFVLILILLAIFLVATFIMFALQIKGCQAAIDVTKWPEELKDAP